MLRQPYAPYPVYFTGEGNPPPPRPDISPIAIGLTATRTLIKASSQEGHRPLSGVDPEGDPEATALAIELMARGALAGIVTVPGELSVPAPVPAWPPLKELTSRELQVLSLAADGKSNRDIGEALFLSAHTVNSHLRRVKRKWKLPNGDRSLIVATAMREGIIG